MTHQAPITAPQFRNDLARRQQLGTTAWLAALMAGRKTPAAASRNWCLLEVDEAVADVFAEAHIPAAAYLDTRWLEQGPFWNKVPDAALLRLLLDFGIRCVIAPSFADIFYNNCFQNGLLPIALPEDQVRALMGEAKGGNHVFSVDLETQQVTAPSGARFSFKIDPGRKDKMLRGLDSIGETLQAAGDIDAFEHREALNRPWLETA